MASRRDRPADEVPADPAEPVTPPVESFDQHPDATAPEEAPLVDPSGEDGVGVSEFNDTPVAHPEVGKSLSEDQIPYPDWMLALDEPDAEYDVAFRLRGRHDAIHRAVATLATATGLARQYQALGWGGDATVTRISDNTVIAVESAPLTDPNAPI